MSDAANEATYLTVRRKDDEILRLDRRVAAANARIEELEALLAQATALLSDVLEYADLSRRSADPLRDRVKEFEARGFVRRNRWDT